MVSRTLPEKRSQENNVNTPLSIADDAGRRDQPTGILRWLTSTNHKDIGTLYLFFSFTMFIVGGIMALTIRAELFQPGLQIVQPELFNELTTMHGLIMLFGAFCPRSWALRTGRSR
jgi:cytochrome c oxidase subunit I